jgi:hypothetical protein
VYVNIKAQLPDELSQEVNVEGVDENVEQSSHNLHRYMHSIYFLNHGLLLKKEEGRVPSLQLLPNWGGGG